MSVKRPPTISKAVPGLRRTFAHLRPHLRRERRLVVGGCLALLAEIAFRLLEPWPLKFVVDRVLTPALVGQPIGSTLLPSLSTGGWLAVAALAVVAVTGLKAAAVYAGAVSFAVAGHRVMTEVRADLYRHLQRLSLSFHSRERSGDLTMRVMSDVGVVADVGLTALLPLAANTLVMVGMASLMIWLHWPLALLALGLLPGFWFLTWRTGQSLTDVTRKQRRREGAMAATAAESMSAIKTLQALSMESVFAQAFSAQGTKGLHEGAKATRLSARLERAVDVLLALATALVLWYGATLVLRRELSTGELLVFLAYLKSTFKPLQDVAKYTSRLAKAAAAGERIVSILEHEPEIQDLPGAVPAPPFVGAVAFRRVTFAYEPGTPVLDAFDLVIQPGTHVAIIGSSGTGKSTLLNLLMRLQDPQSGVVEVDGRDVRAYTFESLRAQISVVLQESLLFAASVRDNLAYSSPGATPAAIEAAARLANAHEFITEMPQGYDTIIGERGTTLSGGQRQRLAIARAVLRHAPIVLLDEPTVGLDDENARQVVAALTRLCEGRTVISVTHDLQLASRADLIVILDQGRVLEQGTHGELVARAGRYAALASMARQAPTPLPTVAHAATL